MLEPRQVLANGFLQGFAFIDGNNNSQLDDGELRKVGATIELRSADGSTLLATTTTNVDGYYRFDNLASATYRLAEIAPGFVTQSVQIQNTLSSAVAVNGNTQIQVTLTAPDNPAWQDPADPLTVHRLPGLPGVNSAFTLTGTVPAAPFNASTSVANTTNAHQFELFLTGGALSGPTANFYSFCTDLFHANPAVFAVVPSLVPSPPGLAANIGAIGYLYNEFGTNLLSPTNGTALQLALYELIYDVAPNFTSGNFIVNQGSTDPAAYAAAVGYLAASSGKDQRAVFLNVTPPTPIGDTGRQGMIVTEKFNFANRIEGDLVITIVPDATNEVGQSHTFTVTVQQDLGDGIDSDGNGSPFDPVVGAAVTVTLTSINGALAVPSGPFNGITNVNGQFFVTFASATAGKVIGNAFGTHVVNGTPITRDTDPATATPSGPGGSGPATKTYVDAKIIIAPDDTNEVGAPHTFTVTVFADNGDGIDNDGTMGTFDVVGTGEDVTVSLTSINGASAVPAGPLAGVTNASGQFSVTFTSATAGQVIGSATSNVDVGGLVLVRSTNGTGNNSGPARKTFVDAKIIIAPDDTNAVGDPHTFTVTVFADNGDGIDNDGTMGTFDAVGAGEDVTVTLTSINGASAVPPGPFVGVTNANGQFSVTFASATAGQVVGSATSNVDVGGLVLVRTTDGTGNNSGPARKTFVDAKITISPDGVNPVGQAHTFTVIVWADNGDGIDNDGQMGTFDRVGAGQTVTITLDGIGGAIPDVIAPINLPPADPTVIVGATNGLGEFSVTFTSATTGQVIGTATSNVNVAGLILPRTTDGTGNNSGPATKTFIDGQQPPIVVGPDKSLGSQPVIEVLNSVTGAVINTFLAYEASYIGGVRIATGDLTGDGIAEIVTAPGRNHVPLVRVFSQNGTLLTEFLAFDSSFVGGVDVAVGDVDGDGKNDIIAGQSFQGSAVRVFRNVSNPLLAFQQYKSEFFPFGAAFIGGVVVAAADMGTFSNGTVVNAGLLDGIDEIIVGNEAGMRSTVSVFDYTGPVAVQVRSFLPLANNFRGGISIDVARVNGDLIPDIIVGAGNQGNSIVEVRDGLTGALITTFAAFTAAVTPSFQAPTHLASLDLDGNGIADSIVVVQGSDGASRLIRFFNPLTGQLQRSLVESDPRLAGAYFVAALNNAQLPQVIPVAEEPGVGVTSVNVVNGNLVIEGDGGNDVVTITGTGVGGQYVVVTAQGSQTVSGVLGSMLINLHGGDDQLTINKALVAGKISIAMEAGEDAVVLGNNTMVSSAGNLEVDLGAGSDSLTAQRTYIGAAQLFVGGDGDDQLVLAGSYTGGVFVLGISSAGATSVGGGAGNDTVDVRYSFIVGHWSFDGGQGNDAIGINTSACTGNVVVAGGTDNDALVVDTNFFTSGVTINGNAGSDQMKLANSLGIQLAVLLGEDGADTANVQNLTAKNLQLNLGTGADDADVRSNSLDLLFAQLGDGDDELTVFGNLVNGAVDLDGGLGSLDRLFDLGNSFKSTVGKKAFELFA